MDQRINLPFFSPSCRLHPDKLTPPLRAPPPPPYLQALHWLRSGGDLSHVNRSGVVSSSPGEVSSSGGGGGGVRSHSPIPFEPVSGTVIEGLCGALDP